MERAEKGFDAADVYIENRENKRFISINEQIQNIAQKKDTLCRRMYN